MTNWDRLMLLAIAIAAINASYNATEAHRHSHELACLSGADLLCTYHSSNPLTWKLW